MNIWAKKIGRFILTLSFAVSTSIEAKKGAALALLPQLDWRIIEKQATELKESTFRIPGYMIPLEISEDQKGATEFLFVPSLLACLHVMPPPPGMTLYVKMKDSSSAELSVELLWLRGHFIPSKTEALKGAIGKGRAEFTVEGLSVARVTEDEQGAAQNALPLLPNSTLDCNGRDKYEPVCSGEQSTPKKKRDKAAF